MSIVTAGDLADMLTSEARDCIAADIADSILRNSHMHEYRLAAGGDFDYKLAEAVVVVFVNTVMSRRGVDLGLYASDLRAQPSPHPEVRS